MTLRKEIGASEYLSGREGWLAPAAWLLHLNEDKAGVNHPS